MKKLFIAMLLLTSALFADAQQLTQITRAPSTTYVYVGTLEMTDAHSANSQKIIVKILGGSWFADSNGETTYYISNRSGMHIQQVSLGATSSSKLQLKAYKNGDKTDFYIVPNPLDYTSFAVSAFSYGYSLTAKYIPIVVSSTAPTTAEVPLTIVPALTTNENGDLGIGTASPQAKLSVDGNILAKEIKVKTDLSVPDYVFESDYKLPKLEDIEAYINVHKHLPEIPSAKQIESKGLDLAEMNLLLLKKIEELTLHVIDQQKQINKLQAVQAKCKNKQRRR